MDGDDRLLQPWEFSGKPAAVVVQHDELEDTEVGRTDVTHIYDSSAVKLGGAHVNQRELREVRRGGDQALELQTPAVEIEADVVEGEREELGEARESARSGRDKAAAGEVEVDEIAEGEDGGEVDAEYITQYGRPRVEHLDGELLDTLVGEGAEPVVGAFQVAQADAGGEAADGRGAPPQEAGVGRAGEARADPDVEVDDGFPAAVPSVGEAGGAD